ASLAAAGAPPRSPTPLGDQVLELTHELVHVTEGTVHRREAHVRHRIELVEGTHDRLADLPAGDLLLATILQLALDAVGDRLDGVDRHRALLARALQPVHDLGPIEGLPPPVFFTARRWPPPDPLGGGEAFPQMLAGRRGGEGKPVLAGARVAAPFLQARAERAAHGTPASGGRHGAPRRETMAED